MSITWNISLLFHILGQIYNVKISRIRCGQDKESFQINARNQLSRITWHTQSPILIRAPQDGTSRDETVLVPAVQGDVEAVPSDAEA